MAGLRVLDCSVVKGWIAPAYQRPYMHTLHESLADLGRVVVWVVLATPVTAALGVAMDEVVRHSADTSMAQNGESSAIFLAGGAEHSSLLQRALRMGPRHSEEILLHRRWKDGAKKNASSREKNGLGSYGLCG